jgi:hypothetical protein
MLLLSSTIHGNHRTPRRNEYRPHTQHNRSTPQQKTMECWEHEVAIENG